MRDILVNAVAARRPQPGGGRMPRPVGDQRSVSPMRHTKIIATVGPASDSDDMLDALIAAGTDIFRLNFSHGTQDTQGETFVRVRAAATRARREVAILQDLGGPKIRTGRTTDGKPITVRPGERLTIATGDFPGEPGRIATSFAGLAHGVRPGDRLLLADGLIELRVESTSGTEIETTVIEGGDIGEHKGINAPGVPLPASAITPKDADDLRFGVALGVDLIAISFVQTAADLRLARQLIAEAGGSDIPLVAKLERPQALDHLDEILAASDALMVARGDLGLEMPLERVPRAQKEITLAARRSGIPVIVATQVLESMTREARPTRAEVNDAANAVEDGVDAIMLAGETAAGLYPARAVLTLDAIIRDAESCFEIDRRGLRRDGPQDHAQALCEAAVTLANRGDAHAIVAVTRGGGTARRLSALRPRAPIVATTDRDDTARKLAIYWGVTPVCTDIGENVDSAGSLIGEQLVARGLVPSGAAVVLVSINADLTRDDANYLKIKRL
jgi:pyruvate kinase